MTNFRIINNEFKDFLFTNDKLAGFKVDYILSYSSSENYYKIEISPSKNNPNFNSREYFMDNFETEKGLEKLSKFAKENNIGIISY